MNEEKGKTDKPETKSLFDKIFKNEIGEVSMRKVGTVAATIGAYLVSPAMPVNATIKIVGGAVMAIGAMFMALGQFEKNDRS